MAVTDKKKFQRIILHCSDSDFGTALMINEWHLARGFKTIGYHEVICNSYPNASWLKVEGGVPYLLGAVEIGRQINVDEYFDESEMGAHVAGHNTGSYGVCMIGKNNFHNTVLNKALMVVSFRLKQFGLEPCKDTVFGHYELDSGKTCPNINMDEFRNHLINKTFYGDITKEAKKENIKDKENILIKILKTFLSKE